MRASTAGVCRGLSSVRVFVVVLFGLVVFFGLIALFLVYAAATRDYELPITFFRYVGGPAVSLLALLLGGRVLVARLRRAPALGAAGEAPRPVRRGRVKGRRAGPLPSSDRGGRQGVGTSPPLADPGAAQIHPSGTHGSSRGAHGMSRPL